MNQVNQEFERIKNAVIRRYERVPLMYKIGKNRAALINAFEHEFTIDNDHSYLINVQEMSDGLYLQSIFNKCDTAQRLLEALNILASILDIDGINNVCEDLRQIITPNYTDLILLHQLFTEKILLDIAKAVGLKPEKQDAIQRIIDALSVHVKKSLS